ncbi:MAG: energy transducer TonB [Candidatus Acidiferrales bacterium]
MARSTNRAVFNASLLPEAQPRWDLFSAGFGLQIAAVTALVVIPLLLPQKLDIVQRYWTTPVEAPPIVAWKPQPVQPVKVVPVKREVVKEDPKPKPEPVVELPKPRIYAPVVATAPIVKRPAVRKQAPPDMTEVAKAFPDHAPPVSMGSSAIPNLRKPREAVQTGGFGDPEGVRANANTNRAANINVQGAYDMPTGAGSGNGTGGAKGAKGVIASAGFGNGVAVGGPGGPPHGKVEQGGFSDQSTAVAAPKIRQTSNVAGKTTPVEILFKPRPAYSDEAKAKKIEGDVLLQVVFTASGDVKVLRVVQGLGYGLDESAETAARQIRFKPARQDGQTVDSTAIIHIVFELAY